MFIILKNLFFIRFCFYFIQYFIIINKFARKNIQYNLENMIILKKKEVSNFLSKNDRSVYASISNKICLKKLNNSLLSYFGIQFEILIYNKLNIKVKKFFAKPLWKDKNNVYCFELILNNNKIARTVPKYLQKNNNTNLITKMYELINLLISNKIYIRQFHWNNVVVKLLNNKIDYLVIVDYEYSFFVPKIFRSKLKKIYFNSINKIKNKYLKS